MTGVYLRRFVRGLGLAAVALLLLHTNPYAQTCDDWEWVRPSPQGNPLYGACYANGWFYGVGARGAIVRSPDGLTWEHIPAPDAERLNDIAWCGTYYAAVGWDGVILRSTDGAAWEAVHSEPYWCLNTIASNGSLAVAASSGRLLTSSDGYSWTESSYEYGFYDLIWTGVQFVGAGSYGRFHTSTDGLSWTLHTIEGATTFDAVAWSGTTYVFVENDGVVWVSDDLETWESHTLDTTDYLQINDVIWTGGSFYAVSDRRFSPQAGGDPYWAILSSGDGVAWTPHLIPDEMPLRALAAGEGRIVAVGYERADSRNVCAILSSEDGEVWTNHVEYEDFSFERLLWTGAEYRALGYRATGNYDDRGRYVASSPDGETWSFLPLPDEWWQPNGLIWDGSQYVIVGWNSYDGRSLIATSPDGVDWTERHGGIQNMIFRDVSWNGDSYVCVGEFLGSASSGGVIYHSPDGLDWREATADNTYPVRSVDWGGAHYVALGGEVSYKGWSQIIQTSKHGAEWTVQYENIYPDEKGYSELTDAAWNGSLYVAVGRAGEVRISPNGHTWTEPEEDLQVELCSVIWAGDRFLGVGESGSILTTEDPTRCFCRRRCGAALRRTPAPGSSETGRPGPIRAPFIPIRRRGFTTPPSPSKTEPETRWWTTRSRSRSRP